MSTDTIIELSDLYRTYETGAHVKTPALRGVSLSIKRGAFISVAGPSGSGKTTLLNIIGALDKPDGGRVIFSDNDITSLSIHELAAFRLRHIGFVFQSYNLINTLTARENAEYVMLLQGRPPHERKTRAEETLAAVGLSEFMDRVPPEMSGGQQQRVAVARAIAGTPDIILADEPTANLDSETADRLVALMRDLNRSHAITFIISTHDSRVMDMTDTVYRMHDGAIIE